MKTFLPTVSNGRCRNRCLAETCVGKNHVGMNIHERPSGVSVTSRTAELDASHPTNVNKSSR